MAMKGRVADWPGSPFSSARLCLVEGIFECHGKDHYMIPFLTWQAVSLCAVDVCVPITKLLNTAECLEGERVALQADFSLSVFTLQSSWFVFPHCSVTGVDTCQLLFLLPVSCG